MMMIDQKFVIALGSQTTGDSSLWRYQSCSLIPFHVHLFIALGRGCYFLLMLCTVRIPISFYILRDSAQFSCLFTVKANGGHYYVLALTER